MNRPSNRVASKMSDDDKKAVEKAIAEKMSWMSDNQESASREDFEEQKAEMEKIFAPIISGLYEKQGGSAAAEDGGEHEDL